MFTVKHVTYIDPPKPQPGHITGPAYPIEKLYEAADVVYCPVEHIMGYLQLRNGDTFVAGLFGGVAYVMNDHGKTVARYDLADAPQQGDAIAA